MNYAFAIKWLKSFRWNAETICDLYADDFVFEDPALDQHQITDKGELGRIFELYANKDRSNGMGVHNFQIRGYWGDHRSGLIRWQWTPEDCTNFIGLDVKDKYFMAQGHTFHQYDKEGKITRDSSWWEFASILEQIGYPGAKKPYIIGPKSPVAA